MKAPICNTAGLHSRTCLNAFHWVTKLVGGGGGGVAGAGEGGTNAVTERWVHCMTLDDKSQRKLLAAWHCHRLIRRQNQEHSHCSFISLPDAFMHVCT